MAVPSNALLPWINSAGAGGVRNSMVTYQGDGATTTFDFNFTGGYIDQSHVKAYVYDDTSGLTAPWTPVFIGASTVKYEPALPSTKYLVIYRDTQKTVPLVDFSTGAPMTEENLDMTAEQSIFVAAEMADRFDSVNASSADATSRSFEALTKAESALAASATAVDTADSAQASVVVARSESAYAVERADDAYTIATGIDGKAQSALDNSTEAVTTANAASATANGIDAKATQAQADAASAVLIANSASNDANAALDTANSVSDTANAAVTAANNAVAAANAAVPKTGGTMSGTLAFSGVTASDSGVVRTGAGINLGGAWVDWKNARKYPVQIDCGSNQRESAFGLARWTEWGNVHYAAIDALASNGNPRIHFHLSGQDSAWQFTKTAIERGAGGYVWGTWNLNPVSQDNCSIAGFWGGDHRAPYFRRASDGNVTRMPRSSNMHELIWTGSYVDHYIDGSYVGGMLTTNNYSTHAAPRGGRVQWDSGIYEIGSIDRSYDLPAPYVTMGVRGGSGGATANYIFNRGVVLRNY